MSMTERKLVKRVEHMLTLQRKGKLDFSFACPKKARFSCSAVFIKGEGYEGRLGMDETCNKCRALFAHPDRPHFKLYPCPCGSFPSDVPLLAKVDYWMNVIEKWKAVR